METTNAPVEPTTTTPPAPKKNKKKLLLIILPTIAVVCILFFVFVFPAIQGQFLRMHLERSWESHGEGVYDWQTVTPSGEGYYWHFINFSDGKIAYRCALDVRSNTISTATYDYKVISGTQFKVLRENGEWETITVEFPFEDTSIMYFSPALITNKNPESWSHD